MAGCSAGLTVECGSNTYQPDINQNFAGACQQCPEGAVSPKASVSIEDCKCRADYYDSKPTKNEVSCQLCTAGSSCPTIGTTTATIVVNTGWYRSTASSIDLRRCPDGAKDGSGCVGGIGDEGPCKAYAAHGLSVPSAPCQSLTRTHDMADG